MNEMRTNVNASQSLREVVHIVVIYIHIFAQ